MGEVLDVDSDGVAWDMSARVKTMMNITKPLRRVQKMRNRDGKIAMIEIKYERLPIFSYVCATLGHIERDCVVLREDDNRV